MLARLPPPPVRYGAGRTSAGTSTGPPANGTSTSSARAARNASCPSRRPSKPSSTATWLRSAVLQPHSDRPVSIRVGNTGSVLPREMGPRTRRTPGGHGTYWRTSPVARSKSLRCQGQTRPVVGYLASFEGQTHVGARAADSVDRSLRSEQQDLVAPHLDDPAPTLRQLTLPEHLLPPQGAPPFCASRARSGSMIGTVPVERYGTPGGGARGRSTSSDTRHRLGGPRHREQSDYPLPPVLSVPEELARSLQQEKERSASGI